MRKAGWSSLGLLPEAQQQAVRRVGQPHLSLPGRTALIRELWFRRAHRRSSRLYVPLKAGSVCLNAREKTDWLTFDSIFLDQEYRTDYTGSLVLDIGAHHGIYAAYALAGGAEGVIAYEPAPANFEYLERTLKLWPKDSATIECHQAAVGAQAGKATFHLYSESWSHSLIDRNDRPSVSSIDVEIVDFSSVLTRLTSRPNPDRRLIVKMDAEGAEFDILMGTSPSLLNQIDELFVEIHSYVQRDPNEVLQRLGECGFSDLPTSLASDRHHTIHTKRMSPARN